MAEPLIVSVDHEIGREEAVRRLKPIVGYAVKTFPMLKVEEETWIDDRLSFRTRVYGQVTSGSIDVTDRQVRVEMTLPFLLRQFASFAEDTIKTRFAELLRKR